MGALTALAAAGHTTRRLMGTSAGAITASLLAVGYTPQEMLAAVNERLNGKPRFASFMDHPRGDDFTQAQKDASDTMTRSRRCTFRSSRACGPEGASGYSALSHAILDRRMRRGVRRVGIVAWLIEKLAAKGIAGTRHIGGRLRRTKVDLSVVTSDTRIWRCLCSITARRPEFRWLGQCACR